MARQRLGICLGLGMAMQDKEMQENLRKDMTRLRKYRHGEARKGLRLDAIACYKSYCVERLVFISLILNKSLKLFFFHAIQMKIWINIIMRLHHKDGT
jgi:hypothetical protein